MLFLIEIIAAITGMLGVLMVVRQNIWAWPIGIISVTLYAYIFFDAKLYSDVLLHIGYIILNAYCWHSWVWQDTAKKQQDGYVKKLSNGYIMTLGIFLIGASGLLGHYMASQTDAALPYWDAFVVILSVISQYLLANKYMAAWIGWIAVNVLSIGIYWLRELYPTTILYAIYLGLAVWGLIKWRQVYYEQHSLKQYSQKLSSENA